MTIRTVSPAEYLKVPRPHLNWLVTGLIPKPGYLLLLGPPKAGKSFLAFDIAAKISQGADVMGYKTPKPARVCYLQLDTKEAAWTERLRKMADTGYNLDLPNLRLVHQDDQLLPLLVTSPRGSDYLKRLIDTTEPDLFIIDVLREIHDEDENDSTGMKKVFDAMEPILSGLSVLMIHHTRKMSHDERSSGLADPTSLARGSSYITGRVDGYWLLYGDPPLRKLYFESRFQESQTTSAKQGHDGMFTFPDLEQDAILTPKLIALCAENPTLTHHKIGDLAFKRFGCSRATFYRVIQTAPCIHKKSSAQSLYCGGEQDSKAA